MKFDLRYSVSDAARLLVMIRIVLSARSSKTIPHTLSMDTVFEMDFEVGQGLSVSWHI